MIRPLNDLCKVDITNNDFIKGDQGTAENGILLELPDKFNYFGFWSFAFEQSFMARDELDQIYAYYKDLIGQRVYWTAVSERGNILKEGDNQYVFIKLTSLIAADEDTENVAENLHSDGEGGFSI